MKDLSDTAFKSNKDWVMQRRQYRAIKEKIKDWEQSKPGDLAKMDAAIERFSNEINQSMDIVRTTLSKEHRDTLIADIYVQRYCESLTIDNIESEEKAFEQFSALLDGQENLFGQKEFVPISQAEMHEYGTRQKRVAELKQVKSALEKIEKENPEKAKKIRNDPEQMAKLTEKIRSQNKANAKKGGKQAVQANPNEKVGEKKNDGPVVGQ